MIVFSEGVGWIDEESQRIILDVAGRHRLRLGASMLIWLLSMLTLAYHQR